MDQPDAIALHDQAQAEARQKARVVGAYYRQLRAEDVEEYEALRLALAFQRRFVFPDADADALDPDAD